MSVPQSQSSRGLAADVIRSRFSAAMSAMYRQEVPAYGTLLEIVHTINQRTLSATPALKAQLQDNDNLSRLSEERHGAIRLGSAAELCMMRRIFAVMGMHAVGYYDLSSAGIPVHSTAFRPTDNAALAKNPFRVFTSLLRLPLIADDALRAQATAIINQRQIFTPAAVQLTALAETQGGLNAAQATTFINEVLETFRWHADANVTSDTYNKLHAEHRLIADIVCFQGPHINHLTPRTLDIDAVQTAMPAHAITAKAVVEGPPPRRCPILLRQTSFHALSENIRFRDKQQGKHTARFGEVEQRGVALTRKGRALYDELLATTRQKITPAADGSNAAAYQTTLQETFSAFPDDWQLLLTQQLAYFFFSPTTAANTTAATAAANDTVARLIEKGLISYAPITYEDFLPVSAAGIFQSNLGNHVNEKNLHSASRQEFETALGQSVIDEFQLYETMQAESLAHCRRVLAGNSDKLSEK
ncbi:MAG: VOC family protein [Proteobacteria bacterium]|nr:VOC family protein [Pseudomonadota bacterium]